VGRFDVTLREILPEGKSLSHLVLLYGRTKAELVDAFGSIAGPNTRLIDMPSARQDPR
jgi:hypothetical protein